MLGINLSPQIYHHFFSLGFKFKENNENDMTFVVWAGTVFGPRLWLLSACRHLLSASSRIVFVRFLGELKTPKRHFEIN